MQQQNRRCNSARGFPRSASGAADDIKASLNVASGRNLHEKEFIKSLKSPQAVSRKTSKQQLPLESDDFTSKASGLPQVEEFSSNSSSP